MLKRAQICLNMLSWVYYRSYKKKIVVVVRIKSKKRTRKGIVCLYNCVDWRVSICVLYTFFNNFCCCILNMLLVNSFLFNLLDHDVKHMSVRQRRKVLRRIKKREEIFIKEKLKMLWSWFSYVWWGGFDFFH